MSDLDAVLNAHQASCDALDIVADILIKSRKGTTFHNTIFFNKPLEEARRLLIWSKEGMADSVLSLLSSFERIIFDHLGSSPPKRASPKKGYSDLDDAIKHFEGQISPRTYNDAKLLCSYRNWVAHGKRWEQPSSADPASTHKCLTDFMNQAGLR